MARSGRKPLEDWQKSDATRLKALWDKRDPKVSQAAFAVAQGIGETQGIVWQYLNGAIPLNLDVAVKFADGLKCDVRDFSPTLAERRAKLTEPPDGRLPFDYDIPQDQADELLAYFEQLSGAQRKALLTSMREAVDANDLIKRSFQIPALQHPEDTHVAKALTKAPSRAPSGAAPARSRQQLPLFKRKQ